MASNVIGLFETQEVADRVAEDLRAAGFNRRNINRYEGSQDELERELEREGISDADADYYAEGLRSGGALVSVRANDDQVDTAVDIMNRYAGTDTGTTGETTDYVSGDATYAADTGTTGVLGTDLGATDAGVTDVDTSYTDRTAGTTDVSEGEARLAVAEEQLRIGKREVQRGGMRVRRVVTELPVEEQVVLRDETIRVDRRRVDQPISGTDSDLFTEKTYEFTETDEEAVVAKEARVVEEVVVGKEVEERTETVRDTVRRSDVEIEEIGTAYGQTLAGDARYTDREWSDIEADARRDWESQNQGGVWDDVRDSVRSSWERTRGR